METKVTFDGTGVSLETSTGRGTVAWRDVNRIFVYKWDLFAFDLICMRIEAGDNSMNLDEDAEGWLELVEGLPEYLKECVPFAEWFENVAFPAFETNLFVIYERRE
ncbi:MAG: hypothetical protein DMF63_14205 [Acidobacteria bacterium]|nr:MAG: hypothetical protein DMF63_14205 [Acidobacteriota bacterium]